MTRKKSAIIAGIAGQDGSYLAELLIEKGYRDEIYNFAAVSFIPDSWDDPYRAIQITP